MSLQEAIQLNLKLEFESSQWSGIAYHGNTISVNYDTAIQTIGSQFEDFDAVWFSKDISFAEEFANKFYKKNSEDSIRVIFKSRVTLNNYADIDYDAYQQIINISNSDSLHDYIPHLKKLGYDGWMTEGDVNNNPYDDITVFNPNESVELLEAKVFIDDSWSSWISIDQLEHIVYICKINNP